LAGNEGAPKQDPWEALFSRLPLSKLSRRQTFTTAIVGCTSLVAIAGLGFGRLDAAGTILLVALFNAFAVHALRAGNVE
jgi:hypothetical protein